MKTAKYSTIALVALALPISFLQGCGGGGGGGGNSSPSPTATPNPAARTLIVQLRDSTGGVVDGIVTVGSLIKPTVNGDATFIDTPSNPLSSGAKTVSAEVNGVVTTGNATVPTAGSKTFVLTISTSVTPGPTTTPPAPPF